MKPKIKSSLFFFNADIIIKSSFSLTIEWLKVWYELQGSIIYHTKLEYAEVFIL